MRRTRLLTPLARQSYPAGVKTLATTVLFVALLGSVASGCGPSVAADYQLLLEPRIPSNQDPFAQFPVVKLIIYEDDGFELFNVGQTLNNNVDQDDLPPLDNARVGVLLESQGGSEGGYSPDFLLSYGESGPWDLSTGLLTQPFLLSGFGSVGDMGELDSPMLHGDAVMTTAGQVILVGGASSTVSASGQTSDRLLTIADPDVDDWEFLPLASLANLGLWQRASLVEVDDEELVLISGGRSDFFAPASGTRAWELIDPVSGEQVSEGNLLEVRNEHVAVTMHNGKVMMIGGYDQSGNANGNATVEIFDPVAEVSSREVGQTLATPAVGMAAVSLGTEGVLVCGGALHDRSTPWTETPSNACSRVTLQGQIREAAPLPQAVQGLAMARLADGRVLASGGVSTVVTHEETLPAGGPAINAAWLWDPVSDPSPSAWQTLQPMNHARAMHRMVTTPDGRILVIGGVDEAANWSDWGQPIDCMEVFDPDSLRFSETVCNRNGAGAHPIVASHPRHGALVVSGIGRGWTGADAFGWIGYGPTLFE